MARDLVVSVEIDERGKQAIFDTNVFKARRGQTVRWELQVRGRRARSVESLAPRIKFKALPETHQPLLAGGFRRGTIFRADGGVISAVVHTKAPHFRYGYVLELVKGGKATALACVWRPSGQRRGEPLVMAGGEPSGGGKKR